ncbi:Thiol-disulfide oxidoreductase ResA [Labrys miyagiensis]
MISRRAFLTGAATALVSSARDGNANAKEVRGLVLAPFSVAPLPGLPDILVPSLEALQNQVTLLNFWASWCEGCRDEHDFLMDLQEKGVRLAGIDTFDQSESALRYLARHGNPFTLLGIDDRHELIAMLSVESLPQSFLIGPDGQVLWETREGLDHASEAELLEKISATGH